MGCACSAHDRNRRSRATNDCRYPAISVNCVQILAECHTLCTDSAMTDCSKHIRADYATLCGTPKYDTYKLIAGCVFGVVSIGMPLALSLYIRRNKKALLDNAPHQTPSATALGLGFFYRVYKEKKAHWEVVELFGKLAVTSLVGFIDPDTPLQLYVGIAFAGQHPLGPPSLCRRERSLASLASLAAAPHVCSGQRTVRMQNDVLSTPRNLFVCAAQASTGSSTVAPRRTNASPRTASTSSHR